ncbi:MAG TPA: energy transducer TonB [Gemmatimonadales bacterium]|jgi:TonB family protein|nr:energy transducer TonB [Gemmatimonadales bacterium]
MFDRLIASRRRPDVRRGSTASVLALTLHATLIAGAVYATVGAGEPLPAVVPQDPMIYVDNAPQPDPLAAVVLGDPVLPDLRLGDPPSVVWADLVPADLGVMIDPRVHARWGAAAGPATPSVAAPGGVYLAAVVEEAPALLSGPPLGYPELLRQARVQGRVEVEAVIDTSGRAEAGTIAVVRSPHPAFDEAARDFVRRALFRPGRMHGRAVRVLVRVPIEFALR